MSPIKVATSLTIAAALVLAGCREQSPLGSAFKDQIIAGRIATPPDGGNGKSGAVLTFTIGVQCLGETDDFDVLITDNKGRFSSDEFLEAVAKHNADVVRKTGRTDYAIRNEGTLRTLYSVCDPRSAD